MGLGKASKIHFVPLSLFKRCERVKRTTRSLKVLPWAPFMSFAPVAVHFPRSITGKALLTLETVPLTEKVLNRFLQP